MRTREIMEGKFVNGKLNGKGFYKNLTSFYEGEFLNSKKNGKGVLKTQKYIYSGDFDNDEFNGNGNIEFLEEGSKYLRKVGYEVVKSIKSSRPKIDNAVYLFMLKKENEGKPKKVAKIAGLNKFLRIYYARVKELYSNSQ